MDETRDGLSIACRRIAEEAERRTGSLDLSNLGLATLPEEVFALSHLRWLDVGGYEIPGDRSWHAGTKARPNLIGAQVGLLVRLTRLEVLSLRGTDLTNLEPLVGLTSLQSLDCSHTLVSDLAPLASLTALQSLDCSGALVSDLAPLASLTALQSLDCSGALVSDLAPLASLTALQSLDCSGTLVSDLAPLASLTALQSLDCSFIEVSDLAPLASLTALQSLDCSGTGTDVSDLAPLVSLTALELLSCSYTQVSDLAPLASLTTLQSLDCSRTQVSDLAPLASLTALQSLDCLGTRVSDLAPLASLTALQSLVCSQTQVSDFAPLASLAALQSLDCSYTQVSDLAPLASLTALQSLSCSRCRLTNVPEELLHLPSLKRLVLHESHVPGIQAEVLSESSNDDCLESVRAHLRDRASGAEPVRDLKLIVLGNGRVGKTQICRKLRGETYDDTIPSTHGIQVTSAALAGTGCASADRLNIWDFGGQDLYHGTHALFIRTRALFLLVWSPEFEGTQEQHADGAVFRNHRLEYWGAYIRHLAESNSPVLVVQTRCDRPEDEALRPPLSDETLSAFRFRKVVHYSAKFDRGRAALNEALHDAAHWLHEQQGIATIGVGRLKVQRRLEEMRDADAARPPDQRRYRTITQRQFRRYCDQAGGVSSAKHLLSYLHNAGIVFHRPGLFHDSIVLDQSWALDAIYAVFHRRPDLPVHAAHRCRRQGVCDPERQISPIRLLHVRAVRNLTKQQMERPGLPRPHPGLCAPRRCDLRHQPAPPVLYPLEAAIRGNRLAHQAARGRHIGPQGLQRIPADEAILPECIRGARHDRGHRPPAYLRAASGLRPRRPVPAPNTGEMRLIGSPPTVPPAMAYTTEPASRDSSICLILRLKSASRKGVKEGLNADVRRCTQMHADSDRLSSAAHSPCSIHPGSVNHAEPSACISVHLSSSAFKLSCPAAPQGSQSGPRPYAIAASPSRRGGRLHAIGNARLR